MKSVLVLLLLAGASGVASLAGEECGLGVAEGTSWHWELALWPPGGECVYQLPGGEVRRVGTGSTSWFLVFAGLGLAAAAAAAAGLRGGRRAVVVMAVLSVGGVGALLGGGQTAIMFGLLLGVPAALVIAAVGRASYADVLAAATALVIATTLWLLGMAAVAAQAIALGVVTLAAVFPVGTGRPPAAEPAA